MNSDYKLISILMIVCLIMTVIYFIDHNHKKEQIESWPTEKQKEFAKFLNNIEKAKPGDFVVLNYEYKPSRTRSETGTAMYQIYIRGDVDNFTLVDLKLADEHAPKAPKYLSYSIYLGDKMELFEITDSIIRREDPNSGWHQEAEHYYLHTSGQIAMMQ